MENIKTVLLKKDNHGITLIALVVTIVVLLILAGVSISLVLGNNGIISKTQDAAADTLTAKEKEAVDLAYTACYMDNPTNNITSDALKTELTNNGYSVEVTTSGDNLVVTFIDTGNKYVMSQSGESVYNDESIKEADVAPTELFHYNILSDTTAEIDYINPNYCNSNKYNWTINGIDSSLTDTNYKVVYNNSELDTLIIPYEYIDSETGKAYTITKVSLEINNGRYWIMPYVNTIIYPNTVTSIGDANRSENSANTTKESTITNIILSNNLKRIENYAFFFYYNLASITIPNSVTSIGDYAFFWCRNLVSITISNSVTSIGNYAFDGCIKLESIAIPNSVTSIGDYEFRDCRGLKSITIPNSVTSIGNSAFDCCTSLASIAIPNSVTSIGDYTFDHCTSLKSITIPKSVTSIGNYAFDYCDSLTTVNYRGTQAEWNAITVGSGNSYLTRATINYNYTGE